MILRFSALLERITTSEVSSKLFSLLGSQVLSKHKLYSKKEICSSLVTGDPKTCKLGEGWVAPN